MTISLFVYGSFAKFSSLSSHDSGRAFHHISQTMRAEIMFHPAFYDQRIIQF
jgi:hypothetical protein